MKENKSFGSIYVKNIQNSLNIKEEYVLEDNIDNIKENILEKLKKSYFNKKFLMSEVEKTILKIESKKNDDKQEMINNEYMIYNMYLNGILNILEEYSLRYLREDKNITKKISKELLEKIYLNNNIYTSISRLEKYAGCPFSYHLRYGLNIKDRENGTNNNLANIGSFMHEIIKETFDYIKENNINENITKQGLPKRDIYVLKEEIIKNNDNELKENLEKYINIIYKIVKDSIKKVKEKEQFVDFKFKKNNEIILNKVEKQMNKICLDINEGIRLSEFKILKNEATFGTGKRDYENIIYEITDNSKIYLEGAIDRIDIGDLNEFRIIDYKSSDKNIEIPKVINGLSLQLITYLSVIEKKLNLKPTAMLYKRLLYGLESKKERLDEKEILKKSKKDLKMSGKLIIQDDKSIEELYIHDTNLGFEGKVKSEVIDIEKTKDNNIMKIKFKNILVKDEYENIRDIVIEKIKDLSKNILEGNVDIYPYKYYVSNNKETACDYCEFKKICKHSKIKNKFRIIRK